MNREFTCFRSALTALGVAVCCGAFPGLAQAHGPVAPAAASYLARIASNPGGVDPKVIDGDQRLWLRVPRSETVVVLDYRGAPYLRFSAAGVEVNQSSAMYYLNLSPSETPPSNLTAATTPRWHPASTGHDYDWHDGRLHALATVALSPGERYVGTWRIPVVIDGHPSAISGGLWYAPNPSLIWLWPIAVVVLCVLAARRLRRNALNRQLASVLAVVALLGTAVAGAGRELHGRPVVGAGQLILLGVILLFVGWALLSLLLGRQGHFLLFVISFVALWAGGSIVTVLFNGFVLMAVPAFVARATAVVCLGFGAGLFLLVLSLIDQPNRSRRRTLNEKVTAD
jgi:hypothetical protein